MHFAPWAQLANFSYRWPNGHAEHGTAGHGDTIVSCCVVSPCRSRGTGTALRGHRRAVSCRWARRPAVPMLAHRRPRMREAGIGRDGEESSRKMPAVPLRLREAGAGRRGGELEKASGRQAARAPPWARPLLASPAAGRPSTVGAAVARRQKEEQGGQS